MKFDTKDQELKIRLSREQLNDLRYKAFHAGFRGVSEYVRFFLFFSNSHIDKIEKIYEKICENNDTISKTIVSTDEK